MIDPRVVKIIFYILISIYIIGLLIAILPFALIGAIGEKRELKRREKFSFQKFQEENR